MQEKFLSPNCSRMANLLPTQVRWRHHGVLIDGVIATIWTLLLGMPLFVVFLLLVYYELYFHGIQVSFSVFHIIGKVVPLHLATLVLWSAVFWTAAFAIRRFFDKKKQLIATQHWLQNSHTQAITDALTGVWNRRGFDMLLETGLKQARNLEQPYTLLLADVNQFKQYNDSNGHLAGDRALQQVGQVLIDAVRIEDSVARYGGDEFAVLCPGLGWNDAVALVQRLHVLFNEKTLLTLSIGTAVFPADGDCRIHLIETADRRLYHSKRRQTER